MALSDSTPSTVGAMIRLERDAHVSYLCDLAHGSRQTQVKIVRRRRKTMAIHVEKDVVTELRVPINCAWTDIQAFLASRTGWIFKAEDQVAQQESKPVDDYRQGGEVSFLGLRCKLHLARSRYSMVDLTDGELYVSCSTPDQPAKVQKRILEWYRTRAEQLFPERIDRIGAQFPSRLAPASVSIRKMKSRWGSCSSRGDICLNLLLMREPLPQIDFVIAHELCHLRHFSHNKAFYALLDQAMPDWRDREERLAKA